MSLRIGCAAATVMWICACAPATVVRPAPKPAFDAAALKATLLRIWSEQLQALERGDLDGFGQRVLPGAFAVGVEGKDLAPSRADWLRQLGPLWHKGRYTVRSTSPVVGLTSDGRAAWLSDVVDVTPAGQQKGAVGIRVSQVFAEADGAWWVAAAHWSVGVPLPVVERDHARWKQRPLAGATASGATAVVAVYDRGLASAVDFLDTLSARADAVFFGLAPEEHIDGGLSVKDVMGEQLKTLGVHFRRLGDVVADVTPNGRVGWVAGQIEVTLPSKTRVPARALFTYENDGGVWRQVAGHLSLSVENVLP